MYTHICTASFPGSPLLFALNARFFFTRTIKPIIIIATTERSGRAWE
jgi:hypothetical protein